MNNLESDLNDFSVPSSPPGAPLVRQYTTNKLRKLQQETRFDEPSISSQKNSCVTADFSNKLSHIAYSKAYALNRPGLFGCNKYIKYNPNTQKYCCSDTKITDQEFYDYINNILLEYLNISGKMFNTKIQQNFLKFLDMRMNI
jgi:hypothetical protein